MFASRRRSHASSQARGSALGLVVIACGSSSGTRPSATQKIGGDTKRSRQGKLQDHRRSRDEGEALVVREDRSLFVIDDSRRWVRAGEPHHRLPGVHRRDRGDEGRDARLSRRGHHDLDLDGLRQGRSMRSAREQRRRRRRPRGQHVLRDTAALARSQRREREGRLRMRGRGGHGGRERRDAARDDARLARRPEPGQFLRDDALLAIVILTDGTTARRGRRTTRPSRGLATSRTSRAGTFLDKLHPEPRPVGGRGHHAQATATAGRTSAKGEGRAAPSFLRVARGQAWLDVFDLRAISRCR